MQAPSSPSLATEKLLCVALYSDPAEEGFGGVMALLYQGIHREAGELGCPLSVAVFDERDPHSMQRMLASLRSGRIKGLLLVGIVEPGLQQAAAAARLPCVLVDHFPSPGLQVDSVETDSEGDTREAVRILHRTGHRRIAFIDRERQELNPYRRRGFERGLRDTGLPLQPEYLAVATPRVKSAEAAFQKILSAKERPTVLLVYDMLTAHTVCEMAARRGIQVPADLGVLTFSGKGVQSARNISRMETDFEQLGALAIRRLVERLSGATGPSTRTILPGLFLMGETTRFLAFATVP